LLGKTVPGGGKKLLVPNKTKRKTPKLKKSVRVEGESVRTKLKKKKGGRGGG